MQALKRRPVQLAVCVVAVLALWVGSGASTPVSAQTADTSFNPSFDVTVADATPGAARATTTTFAVPYPGNINFADLITFDPAEEMTPSCNVDTNSDGLADIRDNDGNGTADTAECLETTALAGTLSASLNIGTLNSPCSAVALEVDFDLFAVPAPDDVPDPRDSTNIAYTQPVGTADRFSRWGTSPIGAGGGTPVDYGGDGTADADNIAFKGYPEYLLELYDPDGAAGPDEPLVPLAVYGGIAEVAGESLPLYFVTFEPGAPAAVFERPAPLAQATANQGYPSQTVLSDPTQVEPNPSDITAMCATAFVMELAATAGGVTRATNPSLTEFNLAWVASERDLDDDGVENAIDTCPFDANVDPDPRTGAGDPDGDLIDSSCDPNPGTDDGSDIDGDGWPNQQDNCPLVANPSQLDSELALGVGAGYADGRADDGGPLGDGIGDACDAGSVEVTYNGVSHTLALGSTVANGRWRARGLVVPICYTTVASEDDDGDGYCQTDADNLDNTPDRWNAWMTDPDLNVVLGALSSVTAGSWDTDGAGGDPIVGGDGLTDAGFDSDWLETYVGTDPAQPCSLTSSTVDEGEIDAWILDTNGDGKATLGDVLAVLPVWGWPVVSDAHRRFDWNVDGKVGLPDILLIAAAFNNKCLPVAQPQ